MTGADFAICCMVSLAFLMVTVFAACDYLNDTKEKRYALRMEREKTKRLKMEIEAKRKGR